MAETLTPAFSALAVTQASQQLVAVFKAVADPLRLDILRVLVHESFGVQELASIFAMPQPGMSHHLKILSKAGLLVTRRQGNSIFYRRCLLQREMPYYEVLVSLFATIEALPLSAELKERMRKVYEDRSAQSRLFFERYVDKFRERQGMLCELDQYLPNLKEVLDIMALPRASCVMEVGPGQGQLLEELTQRYERLIALDNSEEMLALTQRTVGLRPGVRYLQGSLEDYEEAGALDAVLLNMVLHHLSSPQQVFAKVRQLLRVGGFLVIADLCSHNQEWTRSSCGDVWLGFDPQDLREWAQLAGFIEWQSLYLGLKNGFQIQMKLFCATP